MAYRNGTYVAFNGCGTTNPAESDLKYYGLLLNWNKDNNFELNFSNSHAKTYRVLADSLKETLQNRLMDRMRNSKHMLLILTENSSWNRGLLNFEIEKAIDFYEIPIIAAYTNFNFILNTVDTNILSKYWPDALKKRIKNNTAKVLHIPFKEKVIDHAIKSYDVHNGLINDSMLFIKREMYQEWGLIPDLTKLNTKLINTVSNSGYTPQPFGLGQKSYLPKAVLPSKRLEPSLPRRLPPFPQKPKL